MSRGGWRHWSHSRVTFALTAFVVVAASGVLYVELSLSELEDSVATSDRRVRVIPTETSIAHVVSAHDPEAQGRTAAPTTVAPTSAPASDPSVAALTASDPSRSPPAVVDSPQTRAPSASHSDESDRNHVAIASAQKSARAERNTAARAVAAQGDVSPPTPQPTTVPRTTPTTHVAPEVTTQSAEPTQIAATLRASDAAPQPRSRPRAQSLEPARDAPLAQPRDSKAAPRAQSLAPARDAPIAQPRDSSAALSAAPASARALEQKPAAPALKTVSATTVSALPSASPNRRNVPIILYATNWCPACKRARDYMRQRNIPYVERDIEADADALAAAHRLNPSGSLPTIDVGGKVLVTWFPPDFEDALTQGASK